jgi:hypothetical protein
LLLDWAEQDASPAYEDKQATETDFIDAATLCLERGADINASSENGQTALHLAVTVRSEAFIKFLIDRGAKVDTKDKQGRTPVDVASGAGARGRGSGNPGSRERRRAAARGDEPNITKLSDCQTSFFS